MTQFSVLLKDGSAVCGAWHHPRVYVVEDMLLNDQVSNSNLLMVFY